MTKDQRVSRMTAGDVKVDDYFSAIDQGLALWLATEKQQRPRADRYQALCAGSCEALAVAIEVLRFFALRRTRREVEWSYWRGGRRSSAMHAEELLRQLTERQRLWDAVSW